MTKELRNYNAHLPVQIEGQLPIKVPDQNIELIFYCASGNLSQTALETARQMGYPNVFNFGRLNDWPYETESMSNIKSGNEKANTESPASRS